MSRKPDTRRSLKKVRAKAVGKAPAWLKTVQISKSQGRARVEGTFGAASPVVRIDPRTMRPFGDEA